MNILHLHKLFVSPHEGWAEIARLHPSVLRLSLLLVLPLSLLPPLMLEYAGRQHGALLFPDVPTQAWSGAAAAFLVAELVSVPLMAWAIRAVANSKGAACDYHDAYTLAAIAPIPLWLSSLALFSGNVALLIGAFALGLAGSVTLIFRGVEEILKVREDLPAFEVAYIVTALGLVAWAVLVVLGLAPAIA